MRSLTIRNKPLQRRETPISYLGEGNNVLWELKPQPQSDVAFHRGADIAMLSQFAAEEEVLFPPCTMLVVIPPNPENPEQQTAHAPADARQGPAS